MKVCPNCHGNAFNDCDKCFRCGKPFITAPSIPPPPTSKVQAAQKMPREQIHGMAAARRAKKVLLLLPVAITISLVLAAEAKGENVSGLLGALAGIVVLLLVLTFLWIIIATVATSFRDWWRSGK